MTPVSDLSMAEARGRTGVSAREAFLGVGLKGKRGGNQRETFISLSLFHILKQLVDDQRNEWMW